MPLFKYAFLWLLVGISTLVSAQKSYVYVEEYKDFYDGLALYDQGLFAAAKDKLDHFINRRIFPQDQSLRRIQIKAKLLRAKSALYAGDPTAETLVYNFIKENRPDPDVELAMIDLANYFYQKRKYRDALVYLKDVRVNALSAEKKEEVLFKQGYAYFATKDYKNAYDRFSSIDVRGGQYAEPTAYYEGMSSYYLEDYDQAVKSWQRIANSRRYNKNIPFYIAQIYFNNKEYQKVLDFAVPKLKSGHKGKLADINRLVGQSYFELGDYEKAIKHLTYFAQKSNRLRPEDYYQLGYAHFQTGDFDKCIEYFSILDRNPSALGQTAMFYLANAHLRKKDYRAAKSAYQKVFAKDYDPALKEEALFQYGKISAQLGNDYDAINALKRFKPESKYYSDAQRLMADVLLYSHNYEEVIRIIDRLQEHNPKIKQAYQEANFQLALKELKGNNTSKATMLLENAKKYPENPEITKRIYFWEGEIANRQKKWRASNDLMTRYLSANPKRDADDFSHPAQAHYTMGYNYLELNQYNKAALSFDAAIKDASSLASIETLRGDAQLRIGDCDFKLKKYARAKQSYQEAIQLRIAGYDYAYFQLGMIEGLTGDQRKKIDYLGDLIGQFPKSQFADDGLLEMANSYIALGEMAEAIDPLKTLVTKYKKSSPLVNKGYFKLGLINYNMGNPNEALVFYKQIMKNNPSPEEAKNALLAIEEIYVNDKKDSDGYFSYLKTIPGYKIDNKEKEEIKFKIAQGYYENGDYAAAVSSLTEYLRAFPRGYYKQKALFLRAESSVLIKDYDRAFSDYSQLVKQGNSNYYLASLANTARIAYNHKKDFKTALQYYKAWENETDKDTEKLEAQVGALKCSSRLGDQKATLNYADKIASNPLAKTEEKVVAQYFLGKAYMASKNLSSAKIALNYVLDNSNEQYAAEARYLLAKAIYMEGKLDEAESKCREAYSNNSAYPFWVAKSLILLSDILKDKGDHFNAKAALEAVIENFKDDKALLQEAQKKLADIDKNDPSKKKLIRDNDKKTLELNYDNQDQ